MSWGQKHVKLNQVITQEAVTASMSRPGAVSNPAWNYKIINLTLPDVGWGIPSTSLTRPQSALWTRSMVIMQYPSCWKRDSAPRGWADLMDSYKHIKCFFLKVCSSLSLLCWISRISARDLFGSLLNSKDIYSEKCLYIAKQYYNAHSMLENWMLIRNNFLFLNDKRKGYLTLFTKINPK